MSLRLRAMAIRFQFDEEKATQAASLIIERHGKGNTISRLSLIKLLYFVDREALRMWLRPITGDIYYCMHHGPILGTVLNLLGYRKRTGGKLWQNHIEAISKYKAVLAVPAGRDRLSDNEKSVIEAVCRVHNGWTPAMMRAKGHKLPEYIPTAKDDRNDLPVERILEKIGYNPSQIGKLQAELHQRAELSALMG